MSDARLFGAAECGAPPKQERVAAAIAVTEPMVIAKRGAVVDFLERRFTRAPAWMPALDLNGPFAWCAHYGARGPQSALRKPLARSLQHGSSGS
jgi:UDP-N-acetyl-D-mannosaminuronic acid transferase (WecB/TagA/CpsF family)